MTAASAYGWWVFVHIVGAFGFFMAHGVSAGVTLKLRRERDLETVLASSRPLVVAGIGFAGLLVILWLMVLKPF